MREFAVGNWWESPTFFHELTTVEFYVRETGQNPFSFPLLEKFHRNPIIIGVELEGDLYTDNDVSISRGCVWLRSAHSKSQLVAQMIQSYWIPYSKVNSKMSLGNVRILPRLCHVAAKAAMRSFRDVTSLLMRGDFSDLSLQGSSRLRRFFSLWLIFG